MTKINNVVRTSSGLRDALFDELDNLRNGNSNPHQARAVASIASQVISSVRMEINYRTFLNEQEATMDTVNKPIQLGSK